MTDTELAHFIELVHKRLTYVECRLDQIDDRHRAAITGISEHNTIT